MKKAKAILALPKDATFDETNSPVGKLVIITSTAGLHAILWDIDMKNPVYRKMLVGLTRSKTEKTLLETKKQLSEYFKRERTLFDLPLILNGTDFQIQAWKQLLKIPYAKTISYGEQAKRLGDKNKARAVGMANGQNPISIVVPCHRVIGSNGNLVGFGGGLEKKAYLLELEKRRSNTA